MVTYSYSLHKGNSWDGILYLIILSLLLNIFYHYLCRLEAYDRNENFGSYVVEGSATWKMDLPDTALYKDISSNTIIPLTPEETTSYMDTHEVKLGEKSKKL